MLTAIEAALNNVRSGGGGPFGAVVVRDGKVLSVAANRVTATNDPTAHAEIVAIREACQALQTFELAGCDLYTSCEPCPMCMAAIYWARLDRVYFGATAADATAAQFDDGRIYEELALPHASRRIPMIPLLREEAQAPFREWQNNPDRIPY